jgi:hypothetical protein
MLLPACDPPLPPVVHWVIVDWHLAGGTGSGVVTVDDISSAEVPETNLYLEWHCGKSRIKLEFYSHHANNTFHVIFF